MRLRDFMKSYGKTSFRLVNGGPSDSVIHEMEMISALLALCDGNPPAFVTWKSFLNYWLFSDGNPPVGTGGFHKQKLVNPNYYIFFLGILKCCWTNSWVASDFSTVYSCDITTINKYQSSSICGNGLLLVWNQAISIKIQTSQLKLPNRSREGKGNSSWNGNIPCQ